MKLWSGTGELLGEGAHADLVRSIAVLGADRFATRSYDGTVAVWRASGSARQMRQSPAADR